MKKSAVRRTKIVKAIDESNGVVGCLGFLLTLVASEGEPFMGSKMGSGDKSEPCKPPDATAGTCCSSILPFRVISGLVFFML